MQYQVTIGIPVYKAVDYIEKTMESAMNQTFQSIEYLIVDDCGGDGSMEIIEQFMEKHVRGGAIRILRNSQNRGVGYCRNRLIDEAQGAYLYFMDSDDTIEPDTIQKLYDAISHHHAEVAYASYEITDLVNHNPSEIYQKDDLKFTNEGELAEYAFKYNHIFHVSVCNCLMSLSFLRQTGLRFIDARFWEDMVFTCELVIKVSKAVLLPDITYHYLRRPDSLSHYQDREQLQKDEIMKNAATIDYLKQKCPSMKGKSYLPYLCYNLEMNSFYIDCHILKQYHRITPKITCAEMRMIMRHPMRLFDILKFRHRLLANLLLWLLGAMPVFASIPSVWLLGKLKRAI